jgi:cytidine deaminase
VYDDNIALVKMCNERRLSLSSSPTQSDFRVFAFLIISSKPDDQYSIIEGTNAEPGYIGGSICAERSALVKLRFLHTEYSLVKVVVVTDSVNSVSPGVLCREYMMSVCVDFNNTSIVMGNCSNSIITECSLGFLFPYPYVYRYQVRRNVVAFAKSFSESMQRPEEGSISKNLYDVALSCCSKDRSKNIHPIQFAAAVLFEDGSMEMAWILKGLEYGCSSDPVTQLVREMDLRYSTKAAEIGDSSSSSSSSEESTAVSTDSIVASRGRLPAPSAPQMLVMVDQFGVAHAPFASARALLIEHGFGGVQVMIHDQSGAFVHVLAKHLAPNPVDGPVLTHDDFPSVEGSGDI